MGTENKNPLVSYKAIFEESSEQYSDPLYSNVKIVGIKEVDTKDNYPVKEFILTIDGEKTWNSVPIETKELEKYQEELNKLKTKAG